MKELLTALVVLMFIVPFTYMFVVDFIDLFQRSLEIYQRKLKPVLITSIQSVIK
jgi:hypothetical protein